MLPQEALLTRVGELCRQDERLVAALTYGSFAQGTADEHSDIEFWLFFAAPPEPLAWLAEIGTLRYVVINEFGAHVVFFPGLIRGEFHFAAAADIETVTSWPARSAPVDRMVVVDRTGALRRALESLPDQPALPGDPAEVAGRFANWLVLAHHVAGRGEFLRAVDALSHVQRHLLWMARLAEGHTEHWLTPSRRAEVELPAGLVTAISRATATADRDSLTAALAAAWHCGRALWLRLADFPPVDLFAELDRRYPPTGS